jgi:lipid-A-disaccharide synthase
MAAAGQEQLLDLSAHAVLGLAEVLKQYFKFRKFRDQVLDLAKRERPDAVVLIDCSGFNLRLTPRLRRDLPGTRIIYYISPQVWASRAGRVKAMQRDIDLLLAILPFEKAWFAKVAPKFNVQWVGHPVLDRIRKVEVAEPNPNFVALLPGSRKTEVEAHLPVLWEAAHHGPQQAGPQIHPAFPERSDSEIFPGNAGEISRAEFHLRVQRRLRHFPSLALRAGPGRFRNGLARMRAGRHSAGRRLSRPSADLRGGTPRGEGQHLSIVNVMANEAIVPEFLQDNLEASAVRRKRSNCSATRNAARR